MSEIITKKKRGRKPKNFNNIIIKNENNCSTEDNIITEEEKIIFHLPITMNEINNNDNPDMSIFIKSEKDINLTKVNLHKNKISEDSNSIESIKTSPYVNSNQNKILANNTINKIITHSLNFNKNTKCWWDRNLFNTPAVQLPEDYYNETFYCIGHFCSFNCMKSYNLDLND